MRYIPQSQYTFDEICKQCYDAINRPPQVKKSVISVDYNEVLHFFRREDNVLVAQ